MRPRPRIRITCDFCAQLPRFSGRQCVRCFLGAARRVPYFLLAETVTLYLGEPVAIDSTPDVYTRNEAGGLVRIDGGVIVRPSGWRDETSES